MAEQADARQAQIVEVFEAWRAYQRRPDACALGPGRVKLIRARLAAGYAAASLIALIEYAFEADAAECRFWRGANDDRREYLDLANLFVLRALDDRIERAQVWKEGDDVARGKHTAITMPNAQAAVLPRRGAR